jgi:hypothetical protein
LPVEKCRKKGKKRVEYVKLKAKTLQDVRAKALGWKWLLIDEISTVSVQTLEHIHRRLCEVHGTGLDVPFAGLNILAIGDFYQLSPVEAKSSLVSWGGVGLLKQAIFGGRTSREGGSSKINGRKKTIGGLPSLMLSVTTMTKRPSRQDSRRCKVDCPSA